MFLFSKEKKVSELLNSHVDVVGNCLQLTYNTVDFYFTNKLDEAKNPNQHVGQPPHQSHLQRSRYQDI